MSPAAERNDPYRKNHFLVEIDGMASASFLSVQGIESITEVIEYRNGNEEPCLVAFRDCINAPISSCAVALRRIASYGAGAWLYWKGAPSAAMA